MTYYQSITQILRIISVRCIPLSLRSKTRGRETLLFPTWIYSCRSRVTLNSLPFTTNVTINFPFLSSNVPSSPAYGIFISQLIRYARACSSYECFILRAARLSSKLLGQGYVMERFKSSLRKFYGRYGDLIGHYEVSLSHVTWHSGTWPYTMTSSIYQTLHQFANLLPNWTFF